MVSVQEYSVSPRYSLDFSLTTLNSSTFQLEIGTREADFVSRRKEQKKKRGARWKDLKAPGA